jgi:hypothetical protein
MLTGDVITATSLYFFRKTVDFNDQKTNSKFQLIMRQYKLDGMPGGIPELGVVGVCAKLALEKGA